MIKHIIIALFFAEAAFAIKIGDWDYPESEISGMHEGLRKLSELAEESKKNPSKDLIPRLGVGLRKTSMTSIFVVGDRDAVNRQLRDAMLVIPGHAEYYGMRISDSYAAFKGTVLGERKDGSVAEVVQEMTWGFRTLSQLPSPETVKVMGRLLSETWEAPQPTLGDILRPSSLAIHTVAPFSRLPFVDPPTPSLEDYQGRENLSSWQQWYAEVKSGQRSFAFRGQPVSYRFKPDGTMDTTPRDASRDPADPPPIKKEGPKETLPEAAKPEASATKTSWIIGGAAALVAAVVGIVLRKKKAANL